MNNERQIEVIDVDAEPSNRLNLPNPIDKLKANIRDRRGSTILNPVIEQQEVESKEFSSSS